VFALVSVQIELSERMFAWARPYERYQLDELPGVLLVLVLGLAWYAWRRVGDARQELRLRSEAEERLRHALADKRELAATALRRQEHDRRELAREMHDELGQLINAAKIDAVTLRDAAADDGVSLTTDAIVRSLDHMDGVVRGILQRLRPVGLDELGLDAALEDCVDRWRRRLPGVDFRLAIDDRLGGFHEATSIAIYRLVQEGMTNVAKHAHATAVDIEVARDPESRSVRLSVRDNGVGSRDPYGRHGLGLIGMRERVESLGGEFLIRGADSGFSFTARLPIRGPESA